LETYNISFMYYVAHRVAKHFFRALTLLSDTILQLIENLPKLGSKPNEA
jgi:hypothetical protein